MGSFPHGKASFLPSMVEQSMEKWKSADFQFLWMMHKLALSVFVCAVTSKFLGFGGRVLRIKIFFF